MHRREALTALVALVATPRSLSAQTRTPSLALFWIEETKPSPYLAPFFEGLGEQGYVPGRDIRIDDRFLVRDYNEVADVATRLAIAKPDLILTFGATAVQAASKATRSIPIIMIGGGDPVKLGVVQSLSRPGGNVTGFTVISADLSGKRIELLKQLFPEMRRLAVVLYPRSSTEVAALRNYEAAGRALGVEVRAVEILSPDAIAAAIAGMARAGVDAAAFVGSTLFRAHRRQIVAEMSRTRLPAIYNDDSFTEAGGLLSYGPSITTAFRRAATYVDKILKGAKPADLPVQQPTQLDLIVNLRTAKAQGIVIPRSIVQRADRVIR